MAPRLAIRSSFLRRAAVDAALLVALGLFMGVVGPFDSDLLPAGLRFPYWLACIVGGGIIGVAIDETVGRRLGGFMRRAFVSALLMTPLVAIFVTMLSREMFGPQANRNFMGLLWQVFVISALVMSFRAFVWRTPEPRVETRTVFAPPTPESEAAFRSRLSARRRAAGLIAVEAHDHYLRVHTDAGPELLTMRFADALAELSGVHGFQTHRSWWVAADAIEAVKWRRGAGEARLRADVVAPVSRTHAPTLKAAGWF